MVSQSTEFSPFEIRMIKTLSNNNTDQDIADMLEKPVADIKQLISDITGGGVSPFEKQQEEKRKASSRNKEILRQQKQQEQSLKEHASHKRQSYTPPKRKEKMFATKTMDYSQLVAIHIDDNHHTTIYAKPGEDIADCKARYLDQLEKKKKVVYASLRTTTVKKFKPI
jgi:hypothetical protein